MKIAMRHFNCKISLEFTSQRANILKSKFRTEYVVCIFLASISEKQFSRTVSNLQIVGMENKPASTSPLISPYVKHWLDFTTRPLNIILRKNFPQKPKSRMHLPPLDCRLQDCRTVGLWILTTKGAGNGGRAGMT